MLLALAFAVLCVDCHEQTVKDFARSPMGRTSGVVDPAASVPGAFLHPASRTRFEIVRTPKTLDLRWGKQVQPLPFFIGSGRMGRSYAFLDDGFLYQAPVGYYATRHAWDMAPGYETDTKPDLSRPIGADCLFCHASGVNVVPGTLNRIANPEALQGVTCERCHGDGAEHAARPLKSNIVNPKSLGSAARDSICEQCHLAGQVRVTLPGKKLAEYRPGAELADFLQVFVAAGKPRGVPVNGHSEALAQSRCRLASGEVPGCGTCHNPHTKTASYREKCLGCHQAGDCPSPASVNGDCTTCHMPKARAFDGGHTVFTNHSIPKIPLHDIRREQVHEIRPYFTHPLPHGLESRNLGLAYSELGRQERQPEMLAKAWPYLREALADGVRDPVLLTRIALMLQTAGNADQASEYYRQSLLTDPNQMEALLNLATLKERAGNKEEAAALRQRASLLCPRCISRGNK